MINFYFFWLPGFVFGFCFAFRWLFCDAISEFAELLSEFVPEEGTKNQSYCSIECKRLEHNRRARDRYHEMRYIEPQAATMAAAILPGEPTHDEKIAAAQAMGMTYGQYVLMLRQRKGEI